MSNPFFSSVPYLSEEEFNKIKKSLNALSSEKLEELQGYYKNAEEAELDAEKFPFKESVKQFLIENAIPINHSLTAAVLFDIFKTLIAR